MRHSRSPISTETWPPVELPSAEEADAAGVRAGLFGLGRGQAQHHVLGQLTGFLPGAT